MEATVVRKHRLGKNVKTRTATLTLPDGLTVWQAVQQALQIAQDPQMYTFGDTGMDCGEYTVTVTHLDGHAVPERPTDDPVPPKGE